RVIIGPRSDPPKIVVIFVAGLSSPAVFIRVGGRLIAHVSSFRSGNAMSADSTPTTSWDTIAAELRAYRQQQKQTWGDLDHALIGRYLAGEVSPEERALVEAELAEHPELRTLTDVVSGVLTGIDTVQTTTEGPRILTFPG